MPGLRLIHASKRAPDGPCQLSPVRAQYVPWYMHRISDFFCYTPSLNEVCGQNRVRSITATLLAGFILYLHILSSNFWGPSQYKNVVLPISLTWEYPYICFGLIRIPFTQFPPWIPHWHRDNLIAPMPAKHLWRIWANIEYIKWIHRNWHYGHNETRQNKDMYILHYWDVSLCVRNKITNTTTGHTSRISYSDTQGISLLLWLPSVSLCCGCCYD